MTQAEARAQAKNQADGYTATVESLEPNLWCVDQNAAMTSIAISLKRLADSQEVFLEAFKRAKGIY